MNDNDEIGNTPPPGLPDPDGPTEEAPTREAGADAGGGADQPRRFLRSRDDRIVAGVAGGLGRYFDIDPVIIRIAFAVSVLFGGLGVVAYLLIALFVPSDDGTGVPVQGGRGREIGRVLGIAAIAAIVLGGFVVLVGAAAFVTGLGFGLPVAILVVILGIAMAAMSFRGSIRWLLIPAMALSIGVGAAAAADLDLKGGIGDRDYRPQSASAIPDGGYELGVGRLAVDLRGIDWSPKQVIDLDLRVGAGQALVAVPSDVCVIADAHMGAGMIRVAGQQSDGFDVDLATGQGARGLPALRIDAEGSAGEIRIANDDNVPISKLDRFPHEPFESGEAARAANRKACAR